MKKFKGFGEYKGLPDEPIEPVYPLEEALLGGVVTKFVKPIAKAVKKQADLLTRPKVKNSIYEYLPGRGTDKKYVQRYVHNPAEIASIRETGYMLPKPGGKAQKYFTAVDEVKPGPKETLRIPKDKVPAERAVRKRDVERYNAEKEAWEPLKKGGVVKLKSASQRGDGCAKRGKTRGKCK